MAPRYQSTHKEGFVKKTGPDVDNSRCDSNIEDEGLKMSVTQKLLLSSELWGMEASCAFEHLYTVPVLQTLGMPLSLVSLTGLVAGPSAMVLLPFLGWLTDRGSNPQRRKTGAIIFAAVLVIAGMACLLMANLLHLNDLLDYKVQMDSVFSNASVSTSLSSNDSATVYEVPGSSFGYVTYSQHMTGPVSSFQALGSAVEYSTASPQTIDASEESMPSSEAVPFRAGLGMLGFVLMDIGFDAMNAFVRTFMLACSPRQEHAALLVLGPVMASAGGVSTVAIGVADLSPLLGLSYIEGGNLTIQTSVQGLLVIVLVALGLLITLLLGRRQLRLTKEYDSLLSKKPDADITYHNTNHQSEEQMTTSSHLHTLECSIRSFGGGAVSFDQTLVFLTEDQATSTEQTPLLLENEMLGDSGEFVAPPVTSGCGSYGTNVSTFTCSTRKTLEDVPEEEDPTSLKTFRNNAQHIVPTCSEHLSIAKTAPEGVPGDGLDAEKGAGARQPCCRQSFLVKVVLITISVYFGTGAVLMFTMTSSDFVSKAIYGGDPDAAPGSESLQRYDEGMRMASRGFLLFYVTYLVVCVLHSRILAVLGLRVEFVLTHLSLALSMLILTLTVRLEAFFFVTVVAGFQRSSFFTIVFAATNNIVQSRVNAKGQGRISLGLVMSVVTAAMPLCYCTIFPWIGFLEDLTGSVHVPLWMDIGCCCGSVLAFVMIEKL